MKYVFLWWAGYVRVSVRGPAPERMINLATAHGMPLWEGSGRGNKVTLIMLASDFLRVRPLARRCRCVLHLEEKVGLPFLWRQVGNRPGLVAGACLGIACLLLLNSVVLFVEVRGVSQAHRQQLLTVMQEQGLRPLLLKYSFPREQFEEAVTAALPYVSWTRLSYRGSLARVEVAEREVPAPPPVAEGPADVVAARDGELVYFLALMGVPQAKQGDRVRAGQVLVSGTIPGRPLEEGKTGPARLVSAKAICLARVQYRARANVSCRQVVMRPTGRTWQSWVARAGGKEIVFRGDVPFRDFNCQETRAFTWGRNGRFSVEVVRTSYRETEPVTYVLTGQQAAEAARHKAMEDALALVPAGAERERIDAEVRVSEEGAVAEVVVTVVEDIGRVVPR